VKRPRPKLGQHFLAHAGIRQRILDLLGVSPRDTWLEIGAGHGEMTDLLAQTGAQILAVETDPALVRQLQTRFADSPNVRLLHADILKLSLAEVARSALLSGSARIRVYGNLPYYITSPILQRLFAALDPIADIFVVVQREVAERLVASPKRRDYGYLSALAQFYTQPEILLRIPPGAFRPPPRVHSALVRLAPPGVGAGIPASEAEAFLRFLGLCFRHKRKTLFNNLRGEFAADRLREVVAERGHSLKTRAEELPVPALLALYRSLTG